MKVVRRKNCELLRLFSAATEVVPLPFELMFQTRPGDPNLVGRRYNPPMLDEVEFRKHADEAFASLKKSLIAAEDDAEIEVEDQSGALHISFEDGARFVVSPNAPVRQIWISALTTSFKLDWSEEEQDFVLAKTGERLKPLMSRVINQQLGEEVVELE
jgi:iron donor protein CyaY